MPMGDLEHQWSPMFPTAAQRLAAGSRLTLFEVMSSAGLELLAAIAAALLLIFGLSSSSSLSAVPVSESLCRLAACRAATHRNI